jgi:hypothetical protein
MNDQLDQLTDAELSEAFAVEVAGWTWRHSPGAHAVPTRKMLCPPSYVSPTAWGELIFKAGEGLPTAAGIIVDRFAPFPPFTTSADAVLPWLKKAGAWGNKYSPAGGHEVSCYRWSGDKDRVEWFGATAPTFARAACISLIRAKRATA